ncbi:hypothetical protein HC891_14190 [Candidatus Gracilibacteria bacterium]|nr:hypothetical protein [Candidatus Gracilibacteria bacterium]
MLSREAMEIEQGPRGRRNSALGLSIAAVLGAISGGWLSQRWQASALKRPSVAGIFRDRSAASQHYDCIGSSSSRHPDGVCRD